MPLSRHAYVEYEPAPDILGRSHIHLLQLGDGMNPITDWNIEDSAEELAEAVARCNEGRHKGHAFTHSPAEIEEAYRCAIMQLLTKDFDAEMADLERNIRRRKKWGGPVPEAVLLPDVSGGWNIMVTDKEGDPHIYKVLKDAEDYLHEIVPNADQIRGAKPNPHGPGYKIDRRFRQR